MKDCRFEVRLSEKELDILKKSADKFGLTLSKYILSVLIPYSLKYGVSEYENK